MNRVDIREGADIARHSRRAANIAHGSQCVRCSSNRNQLGPPVDQAFKVIPIQLPCSGNHPDSSHAQVPVLRELPPRVRVRVVIELRDDYLVAFLQAPSNCARRVERERRHVCAEGDFLWCRI